MRIHWNDLERHLVATKAKAILNQKNIPFHQMGTRDFTDAVKLAQQLVLPKDRQRDITGLGAIPTQVLDYLRGIAPIGIPVAPPVDPTVPLTAAVKQAAPAIVVAEEDPRRRLAKAIAWERIEVPTKEFIDLYNDVREKVSPSLPQVDSVRYLPQDIMNLVLEELDKIKHPAPIEKPLPLEDQKALELGRSLIKALALNPEDVVKYALPFVEKLVKEEVQKARVQLTDEVLSLITSEPKKPEHKYEMSPEGKVTPLPVIQPEPEVHPEIAPVEVRAKPILPPPPAAARAQTRRHVQDSDRGPHDP